MKFSENQRKRLRFHKVVNIICYLICLIWGEWVIMRSFRPSYFTVFFCPFLYSFILYEIMKFGNKSY